jgi:hypothetical protein
VSSALCQLLESKLIALTDEDVPTVSVLVLAQGNEFVAMSLVSNDLSHRSFTVSKVLVTRRLIRSSVDAA